VGRKKAYNNASIMTLRLRQNHAFAGADDFEELHALYLELSPSVQDEIETMELTFEKSIHGMGTKSAFELAMKISMWLAVNWRRDGNEEGNQAGN
jgi:hypothetical protein